jgi:hypothetical protein
VRYFVGNTNEEELALRPGQPCSVYPKVFARSGENSALLTEKINPVRMEGQEIK